MKHFISIADHSNNDLTQIFDKAFELREHRADRNAQQQVLFGKTLAMIFEKPSLRTRVSFEQSMFELGGHAICLVAGEVGLGKREREDDVAQVLSGMVDGIAARVFEHRKLLDLAKGSSVPVINALSDHSHPCQALADAMTLMDEFGRDLSGRTLAYIGDGNNVARSLVILCAKLGMNFVLAAPPGYQLSQQWVAEAAGDAIDRIHLVENATEAVGNADAIYTDTWVSMGQEAEQAQRRVIFADYQINQQLLAAAPKHAVVLHCLPAYRNVEITDQAMDGPQSRVFPQAHNRLHAQKGLLALLLAT
jgi:ornithine carbamoyltransferase